MQIIVKKKGTEPERRRREGIQQILQAYYRREQRDGAKAKFPASKSAIKKLYAER